MADIIASLRYCASRCVQRKPPDPAANVIELLSELRVTPRQVHEMYSFFHRLKLYDSVQSSLGPHELGSGTALRMIREKREWVGGLLENLLNLASCRESISWDAFLFVFLQFCTLSKLEICQVVFYLIALHSKSWTIHFLTTTQLEEFYNDFYNCPVKAFNTSFIDFTKLPSAKYYMTDFIDLAYRFSQLINPFLHIQRELQRSMPSIAFWSNFDNIRIHNRKIGIDFFRHKKVETFLDMINKTQLDREARLAELDKMLGGNTGSPERQRAEAAEAERQKTMAEQNSMPNGFIPLPFGPVGPLREPRKPEQQMRSWMKKHLAENCDPLRGFALGSAAEDTRAQDVSAVLPDNWIAVPDPDRPKRLYYWNRDTDEVSWTPPKLAAVASVEEAKARILSTMGAPLHRAGNSLSEGLVVRALARSTEDREAAMARTLELDFVRKARHGEPKRDDMVNILERSCPCELLIRPVKFVSVVK